MGKRLVLIRHAKSSWQQAGLDDVDRPLNDRGKRDAPLMAKRVKARGLRPQLILSSPAKRARKTAKIVADELGYAKQAIRQDLRLYLQGVEGLLAVLADIEDAAECVFLVGHNPDLSDLAERLTGAGLGDLPTAAVVAVRLAGRRWREAAQAGGAVEWFDYPKQHPPAADLT